MLGEAITHESTPDYDDWGIDTWWNCDQWIEWHKALKSTFGTNEANRIWMEAWNKQGFFDKPLNYCQFKENFNLYLQSQGMEITGVGKVLLLPGKLLSQASDVVDNTASSVKNATSVLQWLLPLSVIGLVVGAGYVAYNKIANE